MASLEERIDRLELDFYKLKKTFRVSEVHDTLIALTRAAEYVELKDTIERLTLRVYELEEKSKKPIVIDDDDDDTKVFDMKAWVEQHLAD